MFLVKNGNSIDADDDDDDVCDDDADEDEDGCEVYEMDKDDVVDDDDGDDDVMETNSARCSTGHMEHEMEH